MKVYYYSFEELGEGKFVLNMRKERLEYPWRMNCYTGYYSGYSFKGRNIYLSLDEINSYFYGNLVTFKKLTKREKKILLDTMTESYKRL